MTQAPASPADLSRRRALNRMRAVALAMLIAAAAIFLATLPVADHPGWAWLHAASEAAMVGGLADWFAVTALFRHPLGVPIPHTAIIPRRKNDLGRQLQQFVNENFLTEALVRERLGQLQLTGTAGRWLARLDNRQRACDLAAGAALAGLRRISDDDVVMFAERVLLPRLAAEPLAPVAGALLEKVVGDDSHRGLVDLAIIELHDWLVDSPAQFERVMGSQAPRWSPGWIDRRVIDHAYRQVVGFCAAMRDTPDHPARQAIDRFLLRLAEDLQHDPETMASFDALERRLLEHPQVLVTTRSLWQSVRRVSEAALTDRGSVLWQRADALLAELAERLESDASLQRRLDGHALDAAGWLVRNYGGELTKIISITVERWDARQASDRIELFVGRDLQFIRINGTVVGAIVGLIIHGVSVLLT